MTDVKINEKTDYMNNQNTLLEGVATWNSCDLSLS